MKDFHFGAKTTQRMLDVNPQPAFLSADAHICPNNAIEATRQPPRLRVLSTFARLFDETALPVTRFSPPLPIRPLTPAALGWKVNWGDISALNSTPKPACSARAHFPLPRGTHSPSRARACHGAFCVALSAATPNSTSIVPGKIHSPLGISRGRITVGARPRLPCFLRDTTLFLLTAEEAFQRNKG